MAEHTQNIRIALPSKGLLSEGSKELLDKVGFGVHNPNPRQYRAQIPSLPEVEVIFQRPSDIVVSVRAGSVDFGITGRDVYLEKRGNNGAIPAGSFDLTPYLPPGTDPFYLRFTALDQGVEGALDRIFLNVVFP